MIPWIGAQFGYDGNYFLGQYLRCLSRDSRVAGIEERRRSKEAIYLLLRSIDNIFIGIDRRIFAGEKEHLDFYAGRCAELIGKPVADGYWVNPARWIQGRIAVFLKKGYNVHQKESNDRYLADKNLLKVLSPLIKLTSEKIEKVAIDAFFQFKIQDDDSLETLLGCIKSLWKKEGELPQIKNMVRGAIECAVTQVLVNLIKSTEGDTSGDPILVTLVKKIETIKDNPVEILKLAGLSETETFLPDPLSGVVYKEVHELLKALIDKTYRPIEEADAVFRGNKAVNAQARKLAVLGSQALTPVIQKAFNYKRMRKKMPGCPEFCDWVSERIAHPYIGKKIQGVLENAITFSIGTIRNNSVPLQNKETFASAYATGLFSRVGSYFFNGPKALTLSDKQRFFRGQGERVLNLLFPNGASDLPLPKDQQKEAFAFIKQEIKFFCNTEASTLHDDLMTEISLQISKTLKEIKGKGSTFFHDDLTGAIDVLVRSGIGDVLYFILCPLIWVFIPILAFLIKKEVRHKKYEGLIYEAAKLFLDLAEGQGVPQLYKGKKVIKLAASRVDSSVLKILLYLSPKGLIHEKVSSSIVDAIKTHLP